MADGFGSHRQRVRSVTAEHDLPGFGQLIQRDQEVVLAIVHQERDESLATNRETTRAAS
jgi:hypothetical protein